LNPTITNWNKFVDELNNKWYNYNWWR
jgi:hypothetical protein